MLLPETTLLRSVVEVEAKWKRRQILHLYSAHWNLVLRCDELVPQ